MGKPVMLRVDTQNGRHYRISRARMVRLYPSLAPTLLKMTRRGEYTSQGKGVPDRIGPRDKRDPDGLRYITRLTASGSKTRRTKKPGSLTSEYDYRTAANMRAATRRFDLAIKKDWGPPHDAHVRTHRAKFGKTTKPRKPRKRKTTRRR